jgi:hypothetical protein
MRTIIRGLLLVAVMMFGPAGAGNASAVAQGADLAAHPLVGSWLLDTDAGTPDNPLSLAIFTSDGIYLEVSEGASPSVGVWESTGDTTGQLTFQFLDGGGMGMVRASVEVSGDTLTAEYTLEFIDPTGSSTGQYGPGMAEGTRIAAEPMGTPAGTLDDLFGQFGPPEATPED